MLDRDWWRLRSPHALLPLPLRTVLATEEESLALAERIVEARERLRQFQIGGRGGCRPLDDTVMANDANVTSA